MEHEMCDSHCTKVSEGNHEYEVVVNSQIDETNTYTKLGYRGQESAFFALNRKLSITNKGRED
jgi:hypothetical protein